MPILLYLFLSMQHEEVVVQLLVEFIDEVVEKEYFHEETESKGKKFTDVIGAEDLETDNKNAKPNREALRSRSRSPIDNSQSKVLQS